MAVLTVGGTEYAVRQVSASATPLTKARRVFSGKISTARPSTAGSAGAWTFQTDLLTRSVAASLVSALRAVGTVTLDGTALWSTSTAVVAHSVSQSEIFDDLVLVSFEAEEASP